MSILDAFAVDVDTARLDVLAGLSLGLDESEVDQHLGQVRHIAGSIAEIGRGFEGAAQGGRVHTLEVTFAEEGFGGGEDTIQLMLSVNHAGDFLGKALLGVAEMRSLFKFLFNGRNLFLIKEGEELEELDDVTVIRVDEVLVEGIRRGHLGIEVDGTLLALAELLAGRGGQQREGQGKGLGLLVFVSGTAADVLTAGGDVAH